MIPCQPVAEDVTLAARSAEDRLQSGSADVQSPQHINVVVPPSPNPGPTTQLQPATDHYRLGHVELGTYHLLHKALIHHSSPSVVCHT